MLSDEEFKALLALIDTLDENGVRIMRDSFHHFLEKKSLEEAQRKTAQEKLRKHIATLHASIKNADTGRIEALREKLGLPPNHDPLSS